LPEQAICRLLYQRRLTQRIHHGHLNQLQAGFDECRGTDLAPSSLGPLLGRFGLGTAAISLPRAALKASVVSARVSRTRPEHQRHAEARHRARPGAQRRWAKARSHTGPMRPRASSTPRCSESGRSSRPARNRRSSDIDLGIEGLPAGARPQNLRRNQGRSPHKIDVTALEEAKAQVRWFIRRGRVLPSGESAAWRSNSGR
jgi:hypothetical protein